MVKNIKYGDDATDYEAEQIMEEAKQREQERKEKEQNDSDKNNRRNTDKIN